MSTRESPDSRSFQETEQGVWITLKRVHLIIVIVIPIATMFAGAIGTYYKARADINDQIHSIQIQNTQTFAKQSDVKEIGDKIDGLATEVGKMASEMSHLNGYLKAKGIYAK